MLEEMVRKIRPVVSLARELFEARAKERDLWIECGWLSQKFLRASVNELPMNGSNEHFPV
jgi:hypothetical protein